MEEEGAGRSGNPVVLQRQEEPESTSPTPPSLPPFFLPGTGLRLIPGVLTTSLLGPRLPLPASLRVTNALGFGPGPTFVLDASPQLLVASVLGAIDLHTWTRPGTPTGAELDPESQASISLINPIITLDPSTGKLRGTATLSVGSEYPPALRGPTELDVTIESTELGQFTGRLGFGPLHADFNLRLHYDTTRLEQALSPAIAPAGGFSGLWNRFQAVVRDTVPGVRFGEVSETLQSLLRSVAAGDVEAAEFTTRTIDLIRESVPADASFESLREAVTQFVNELQHPGFTVSGGLGLDIPLVGTLPLTSFSAEAPTTVPLARPLLGAPTPFPSSFTAGGVIISPPGSINETAVPAFGFTHSSSHL